MTDNATDHVVLRQPDVGAGIAGIVGPERRSGKDRRIAMTQEDIDDARDEKRRARHERTAQPSAPPTDLELLEDDALEALVDLHNHYAKPNPFGVTEDVNEAHDRFLLDVYDAAKYLALRRVTRPGFFGADDG